MKCVHRALRSGIAAAFLLGLGAGAAPAAQSDRLDMRFEIYGIAGMHLVTNRTSVETSATRYTIAMSLTTRGLASIFVDLDSHSQAHGSLVGNRVVPEEYSGEIRRNGKDQQTRVGYGTDGTIANDWNSPRIEQAAYVPAAQTRGTVDQLTAYFILERQLAARHTCNATIPVFDGLHRYDLHFVDAPLQPLPENVVRYFPGPVQVCRMIRTRISGPADHEGTYSGKIWYARLGRSGRVLPVQMQFDTELGTVKGYLAALHGDGLDLHLIE